MELFDQKDRKEIEYGLKRVFDFNVPRINGAIAAQVIAHLKDHFSRTYWL